MSEIRFFVNYMSPNGTRDLLVVDDNNAIIDYFPEAVFGNNKKTQYKPVYVSISDHIELQELDFDPEYEEPLWEVKTQDILSHIAVSPMQDGSEIIDFLKKYNKKLK